MSLDFSSIPYLSLMLLLGVVILLLGIFDQVSIKGTTVKLPVWARILVGVIGVLLIVSSAVSYLNSSSLQTPLPSPVSTVFANTPVPPDTPTLTNTPLPTITSMPTNTPTPTQTPRTYLGRVLDAVTNTPIEGAKIQLAFEGAPPVVYTDSEGIYRFTLFADVGKIYGRIWVTADGYERYNRIVDNPLEKTELEDIRLKLLPSPTDTPAPIDTPTPTTTLTDIPTPDGRIGKPPDNSEIFFVYPKYHPSGYMGDIGDITVAELPEAVRFIYEAKGRGAPEEPHKGSHEWEYKYINGELNLNPAKFAGVMYLNPPNNFGVDPNGGFDLRSIRRVIKWEARSVEREVNVEFVIGGVTWIWDDESRERQDAPYPDSMPRLSLGIKTLTEDWQSFEFDLSGKPEDDFKRVVGGFAWVISWGSNGVQLNEEGTPEPSKTFTIEIRNIRYER